MSPRDAFPMAAHVTAKQKQIPILGHLLIGNGRTIACDLTQQVSLPTLLPASLAGKEFCVSAERLNRVLKAIPESRDIEYTLQDDKLILRAGPTRYELNTLKPSDFPRLSSEPEEWTAVTVPSKELIAALSFAGTAMATADVRYYLCGMHMALRGQHLVLTATDGHRLHRARVEIDGDELTGAQGIVPIGTVDRIMELAARHEQIELHFGKTRLRVVDEEELETKLIEGTFPDADRVIPTHLGVTGGVARAALIGAVKRVAQILDAKAPSGIGLKIERDHINLSTSNADGERAAERFEWEAADKGFERLDIAFRHEYLLDALNAYTGEQVFLHLPADSSGALYITDAEAGDRQAVVMPMRI